MASPALVEATDAVRSRCRLIPSGMTEFGHGVGGQGELRCGTLLGLLGG